MSTPPPIDTVTIACRCGHTAPFDAFWQGPNRYRCPGCGVGWRLVRQGQARLTPSGFVIPPTLRIEYLP